MNRTANSASVLGRALRDERRAQGLTQARVGQLAGLTQATVSKVERGAPNTSFDTILRLLAALRLDLVVQRRAAADPAPPWGT